MIGGESKYARLLVNVRKLKAGEAYLAVKGDDFTCEPETFRGVVYQLASSKGMGWKATSVVFGNAVVYAFYQGSDYMRPNLAAYPVIKRMRGE